MDEHKVIIVGGGPAGAACAWKLAAAGTDCLILDRQPFPRRKVCAGWITPDVFRHLETPPENYPFSLFTIDRILIHIYGMTIPIKTIQYAIRRIEFDDWLLKRSRVPVQTHRVRKVQKQESSFIIDDRYRCRFIVGAGGTACPVRRYLFEKGSSREKASWIIALEDEFRCDHREKFCHLWFFHDRLPGYAWFVPKGSGYLNIGLGGSEEKIRARERIITDYWTPFIRELNRQGWIGSTQPEPKGYRYCLRQRKPVAQTDKAYCIGDAAGLATRDLGEGISPAIHSGLLAAESILTENPVHSDPPDGTARLSFCFRSFPYSVTRIPLSLLIND